MIVGQNNRLMFEALLFAASLRHCDPGFSGTLYVAEPQPGKLWPGNPSIQNADVRDALKMLGAEIVPFKSRHFGARYPYGNKAEALYALPKGVPFVFFDTDTLVTGPVSEIAFDFERPAASMRREDTWPKLELYGPGYTQTWRALYDMFGLDFEGSLDPGQPDEYWERYLYFNAGWFFYRCPHQFADALLPKMVAIRKNPPPELICQSLDPWLDQVALPLAIHELGGGRPGPELDALDGATTCHYRVLPLLYAREADRVVDVLEAVSAPNKIKKVLKQYDPFKRMIFQGRGHRVRALFDQANLPRREQAIRNRIKAEKLWMR
ncbi:MAG: hypothetical protein HKN63_11130 [Rhodobacteraceae bacterium]|nr:hypothetical protein [Paracoccaceae bacterium]